MKVAPMINTLSHYISSMFSKGGAVVALWFAVFRELFAKYIFNDWEFVGFLFVLVVLDTVFGMWKAIKTGGWRALNFTQAEKVLVKIFLYFGVLVLSHVLGKFTIHGKPNFIFTWVDAVLYGYMVAKESLSVAKNINSISPGTVATYIIERFDKFEKSGKISDLTKNDNEPENS